MVKKWAFFGDCVLAQLQQMLRLKTMPPSAPVLTESWQSRFIGGVFGNKVTQVALLLQVDSYTF